MSVNSPRLQTGLKSMNIQTVSSMAAGEAVRRRGFALNVNTSRVRRRFLVQVVTVQVDETGDGRQGSICTPGRRVPELSSYRVLESYYMRLSLALPR